ncbi:hypothetical protein chiPu_0027319 [Chiloscyllium punctatum]|uniref:Uncharacterized protein n=1 Tax=Chiloscyllium punctatum TaxID=137246 RepID=A0A401TLM6_CHIPU|nr:hypothetical protein [Chiloscyllium punctatum]
MCPHSWRYNRCTGTYHFDQSVRQVADKNPQTVQLLEHVSDVTAGVVTEIHNFVGFVPDEIALDGGADSSKFLVFFAVRCLGCSRKVRTTGSTLITLECFYKTRVVW